MGPTTSSFTEYSYCEDCGLFQPGLFIFRCVLNCFSKENFCVDKTCWKLFPMGSAPRLYLKNLNPWLGAEWKSNSVAGSPRQSQSNVVLGPD
jgi:hypothetical protein